MIGYIYSTQGTRDRDHRKKDLVEMAEGLGFVGPDRAEVNAFF